MLSNEQQVWPLVALPSDRDLRDLDIFRYPEDPYGPALQHLEGARVEGKVVVLEEEEGKEVEEEEDDPEPPRLYWDDICISDSDDDLVNLEDLVIVDYDDEEGVTDGEETNCPGKKFPREKARQINRLWIASDCKQYSEHIQLCEMLRAQGDENFTLPPFPMKVFPEVTGRCVERGNCYHRRYKTHDTSITKSTLAHPKPDLMLQVFSLRISNSASYPVSVYGIIAVRDDLEPLRNYLYNRPCRDDAVTIDQDSFTLPLCSPCRGMYLLDDALLEVDLWVKEDGDGSADKQILSAYAEIDNCPSFDEMLDGQIRSGLFSLDIGFILFTYCVEAVIQVFAKVDVPHHVRFAAFSSGFDHEILLFDDEFSGNKKLFQHVVAVKAHKKLDVSLKLEESLFWWTFQDGHVGAVRIPDKSMLEYGQFDVRVFFAPKRYPKIIV
ncbi:uncharacterized protein LOC100836740 [Brachypodium distachyon]|uniref:DUF6598 domain-containing protein n=1 Tax=Brachypodium distachyon TaxID=15368 RepID=I1GXW4_BRADI|nr:uncharacterized protein LOC100836740 [Brachypodium distachyon]KQK17934.1 hypothetical protein BRADI_1g37650v3 [Brachypodium distachyon]|eukprot:XP_003563733.1 uncharacterized protein LOC100836740 [Brachypodium distachyon]